MFLKFQISQSPNGDENGGIDGDVNGDDGDDERMPHFMLLGASGFNRFHFRNRRLVRPLPRIQSRVHLGNYLLVHHKSHAEPAKG